MGDDWLSDTLAGMVSQRHDYKPSTMPTDTQRNGDHCKVCGQPQKAPAHATPLNRRRALPS